MIRHAESAVFGPELLVVELDVGREGAGNHDKSHLEGPVVQKASPLTHRNQSYNGERGHGPSHLYA